MTCPAGVVIARRAYSNGRVKGAYVRKGFYEWVKVVRGVGVRTMKFRGGMPLSAPMRITALWRFVNMLALLDSKIRGVGPGKAMGVGREITTHGIQIWCQDSPWSAVLRL